MIDLLNIVTLWSPFSVSISDVYVRAATTRMEMSSFGDADLWGVYRVSAATGVVLASAGTGRHAVFRVAATTRFEGRVIGAEVRIANPVAATTVTIATPAGAIVTRRLVGAATTAVSIGSAATGRSATVLAAATTRFEMRSIGAGRNSIIHVSAMTGFEVGVASGLVFPGAAPETVLGMWRLPMRLGQPGVGPDHYVVASSLVELASSGLGTRERPAAATTVFVVSQVANKDHLGAINVAATTIVDVRSQEKGSPPPVRGRDVAATTVINVRSVGGGWRAILVEAATVLEVGSVAEKRGVSYHVAATTSLEMGLGEDSNEFPHRVGSSGVLMGVLSGARVVGTEVGTGLVIAHLAVAETWLPWRTAPLDLEPGGGLPH